MSWYFDTENWAAGMWNSWAESRTDTWREAMVRAVLASRGWRAPAPASFAVEPAGRRRRRLLVHRHRRHGRRRRLAARAARSAARRWRTSPTCASSSISSDVVYPTGAMRDYEAKFWLPFKGVTQAGLRDSRQSRLVRRARRLRRDVPPAGRRARQHATRGSRPICA